MNSSPQHDFDPELDCDPELANAPPSPEDSGGSASAHVSVAGPTEPWKPDATPLLAPSDVFENPFQTAESVEKQDEPQVTERPLFQSWSEPEIRQPSRTPHLGHVTILAAFAVFGVLCASLLIRTALHYHLFGVTNLQDAVTEIHYALGSEAVLYLLMFGTSLLFFPLIWHKGLFAGMQWNGAIAFNLRRKLFVIATICCGLALANGLLFPGPTDAPIDKIFRTPGAAWLLFAFGVTFAPFFEEMVFRGFLLPAICTACDWIHEKTSGAAARPLDQTGQPQWSFNAMVIASILVSIPFALMHGAQTGYSWGPFCLLVGVSLVLCWARLSTRSLAASVFVHASYNFLLFTLMMLGTGGFRHLDRM
jgi:uncharacterized protein